jgi:rhodanese-related sulfurtransferase
MTAAVDRLLAAARELIGHRPGPAELDGLSAAGALIVDIRPFGLRNRDGDLPGAVVIDRNQLEWRLDPTSEHRLGGFDDADRVVVLVCDEGYASSLAAATLRQLGLTAATDLDGGYQAWNAHRSGGGSGRPTDQTRRQNGGGGVRRSRWR